MSQNLGYAAVNKDGVGIAIFSDLGNFAFPVAHPLYNNILAQVQGEKPLHEFEHLLNEEVFN